MANTYRFHIYSTECFIDYNGLSDVIQKVHWGYEVSDGTNSTTIVGVETMDIPDAENFVAFDELNQDIVASWLESRLDIEGLQTALDERLNRIVNPTIVTKQLPTADNQTEEEVVE